MHPASDSALCRGSDAAATDLLAGLAGLARRISVDPSGVIQQVLLKALSAVGGRFALYSCFDPAESRMITCDGCDLPADYPPSGLAAGRIGYEAFIRANRSEMVIPDLDSSCYATSDPDIRQYQLKAYIGVPVCRNGETIGCLAVYDGRPRDYPTSHVRFLQIGAQWIAQAIEQRTLEQQMARERDSVGKTLLATMTLLAQWHQDRSMSRALDESQALNDQMLQLSPAAIYRIDIRANKFLKVNDLMCVATGYSEEELLAMNPEDLLTPESRHKFHERILEMGAGKNVSNHVDYDIRTKSGRIEWVRFHVRHLYEGDVLWGANVVAHFVTEQKENERELEQYRQQLEALVQERTQELSLTNQKLREEIVRGRETANELRLKTGRLEELNTAMRVLLDKRNEDRLRTEENIRVNLAQLIEPYLDRLGKSGLNAMQKQYLDVIRMNIGEVIGAPMPELSAKYYIFSPTELQVANLIRKGRTTKEMARLLNLSPRTVESYRESIRRKLGLKNRKVNLRTYLSTQE